MSNPMDPKIRELTYRLIAMAPEAPPFPEESMVQLRPSQVPATPARRRSPLVWVGAAAVVALLVVGVPLFLFSGGDEPGPTTIPPATQTTVPPTTSVPVVDVSFDVTLYFLADYVEDSSVAGPHLVPVRRQVTAPVADRSVELSDQLHAAVLALIDGPVATDEAVRAGVSSSIPEGTELLGSIVDQTGAEPRVVLDFNRAFESGGGTFSMTARLAQVVYTATQFGFPSVELTLEGEAVGVFSSEGIVLDGPQTRDDYRSVLPLIFVETPLPGDVVSSPVEIAGVSNTFEAGLQYRFEFEDGTLVTDGFTSAGCGTGCWGDFEFFAGYFLDEPAAGYLVVFESSAQDGRPVNAVRIPVQLEPSLDGSTEGQYLEAYGAYPDGTPFAAPLNGAVVVQSPITISGHTNITTDLLVDGESVPVTNEAFEFSFDLEPGLNEIVLEDGLLNSVFTVTYLPDGERQFGFVTGGVESDDSGTIEGPDGTLYTTPVLLTVDYAQWLSGDAANQAAFEDGVIGSVDEGVPNDYYIRNENPMLRFIPIRPDVIVYLVDINLVLPVRVDVATWLGLVDQGGDGTYFDAGNPMTPYWIVLDAEGYIAQIVQQYIP